MQTVTTSSRRGAIGQLAEFAGAIALASAGAPNPAQAAGEDPHLAWFAEAERLSAYIDAHPDPERDLEDFPEWNRVCDLRDLITDTPATTNAGMIVQCDVALEHMGANDPGIDMGALIEVQVFQSIRATLAGRA